MTQQNHPKFITKCPSIGGNMADRANLTKIEFGTLSTEAERLHIKLELLSYEAGASSLTTSRQTHERKRIIKFG